MRRGFRVILLLSVLLAPAAAARAETSKKLIPLPVYATLPNEGSTFGLMPVVMFVDRETQHTDSILAPSITWNRIIQWTHTFRWYYYPSADESLTLIPSISLNTNRGVTAEYANLSRSEGGCTREAYLHARRSIFYRFFGLGPQTPAGNESSYTRVGGDAGGRVGYNLTRDLNVGARATLYRDLVERKSVSFLPLTNDVFPGTAGLGGATAVAASLTARYDTREQHEYSRLGLASEVSAGAITGLAGAATYSHVELETRGIWPETAFLQGGARAYWSYVGGAGIPFYYQSSLGGSYRLRGFTEDRFIDRGAWLLEVEQRITLFTLHIFGVSSDWRIDPFAAVGQVYGDARDFIRYARFAGGLGFRAFVRPNVLGRIDTAVGGEGVKVYVELGYPF